jgi:hypothetical protein
MTTRAHLLLALGALAAVFVMLRLVGKRQLRSKYALLWLAVAILLVPLAVFPRALDTVADWVGVYYAPTIFLVAAIGFLLLVVVHLSWELSRMETRMRAVAEDLALLRAAVEQGTRPG